MSGERQEITHEMIINAIIEAGIRRQEADGSQSERIDALTPLIKISFRGGDRALMGIEFICAFEATHCPDRNVPKRESRVLMSRLDNGRGTVADLTAIIDRWRNPPKRPKRPKLQPGQMCLDL